MSGLSKFLYINNISELAKYQYNDNFDKFICNNYLQVKTTKIYNYDP